MTQNEKLVAARRYCKESQSSCSSKQGEQELAEQDYAQAAETLLSALHEDPDNRELAAEEADATRKAKAADLKQQAYDAMRDGDYSQAEKLFEMALELDTSDRSLWD